MTTGPHGGAELTDDELRSEIELVGELVVAASSSERPLTDQEIDTVLGVTRGPDVHPDERHATGQRVWHRRGA